MDEKHLNNTLAAIGFKESPADKAQLILITPSDYDLVVTLNHADAFASRISYGKDIKVHHKGILDFKRPENLVVLECVIRLLRKGYSPKHLELEKTWPAGHGHSGRLDILIKEKGKVFAMVECKTWGAEYAKERDNMLEDGGQLFSYAIQESTTSYIVLYASNFVESGGLKYVAEQVDYKDLSGANQVEKYDSWGKSFVVGGILSDDAPLYESLKKNLKKADLIELDEETGAGLFNSFAEILRRHAVSDKSNAFNKIFNLFVCKIYDEDSKKAEEELDFQWKVGDSYEQLIDKRLVSLYQRGLKDYLQIEVHPTYFSPLAEFAFIDIYDEQTYSQNASIIQEVVQLLQQYQLKYTSKHQFLGNFFEDLLNTGIKQEAGQFFTPTVLARFFIKALPVRQLIDKKIESKDFDILPHVIDFACGAGHFLTETIDELQTKIDEIDVNDLVGRIQKRFLAIKENFFWAKDYIYGIEKDYRLSKTTKIAMFLNGDGDAIIVNGDGLDDFQASKTYTERLLSKQPTATLEQFDVLVSNPPFSIAGFKTDVAHSDKNFALAGFASPKSSEIECLFLERAGQLVKEGGLVGIIMPLSILNNETKIYREARKHLLITFEIAGIVELRDKTFKPTNTTTVGLFLRKRAQETLKSAINDLHEAVVKGNASPAASEVLDFCASRKVEVPALKLQAAPAYDASVAGVRIDGVGLGDEFAFALAAYLNEKNETVVAYAGEKKEQEAFLGYRFSKSRGKEGLEILRREDGALDSALYDENDLNNPSKVNAHILSNFNGAKLDVPESLKNCVEYIPTTQLFSPGPLVIDNPSAYFSSENYVIESASPLGDIIDGYAQEPVDLKELIRSGVLEHIGGLVYNKKDSEVPRKTNKRVLTASNLDLKTGKIDVSTKLIYLAENFELPPQMVPQPGDIVMSNASGSLRHLGKVAWVEEEMAGYVIGGFLSILRCGNTELAKALFYRLCSKSFRQHVAGLRGQNINNIDLDKICAAGLTIPTDLKAFYEDITKREHDLRELQQKLKKLRE